MIALRSRRANAVGLLDRRAHRRFHLHVESALRRQAGVNSLPINGSSIRLPMNTPTAATSTSNRCCRA